MGNLTDEQFKAIEEKVELTTDNNLTRQLFGSAMYDLQLQHDHWTCTKFKGALEGDTFMDNGELEEWFKKLGISESEYEIFDDQMIDWDEEDED